MARRKRGNWKKIGVGLGAGLLVLLAVLVVRALGGDEVPTRREPLGLEIDTERAAQRLSAYIQLDTSTPPGIGRDPRPPHLDMLIADYAEPLGLEAAVYEGRILLLRWRAGTTEGGPIVLLSHADVVPVAEDELERWTHAPFGGVIDDGYVWGRGAIDDKGATIAQLEAIAALQAAGLTPRRDVFLLISPDEEIGGAEGAGAVLARHAHRLEEPWAVLDEGTFVAPDFVAGTTIVPVAVGEKRFVTVEVSVNGEAGHSSMPEPNAAPAVLTTALARLHELELEARFLPATDAFLDRISSRASFGERIALRNRWLFGGAVESMLSQRPASNAMIRDTIALTMLRAGVKDNVVPARAVATLNLRLLPDSDLPSILRAIEGAIDDPRVQLAVTVDNGASPVSPTEGEPWERLAAALATAFDEDALVAPMITPGTMDARYFARRGIPTYRLVPFTLDANERGRVHGIDERVSLENLEQAARVYAHVMRYW